MLPYGPIPMRSLLAALWVFWSGAAASQDLPVHVPASPQDPTPETLDKSSQTGFWPADQLYRISLDWFGQERTEDWLQKGLKSLEKNIYRKYYIEGGYFLVPMQGPEASAADREWAMLFVPLDPGNDPRVAFMKDIDKLEESAEGMHQAIRRAQETGDADLIQHAGGALFDSKFTKREWSYKVSESRLGRKPYYYKIDQRNFTELKAESGVGGSLQAGDAPLYFGGSLGAEGSLKFSLKVREFTEDAVPRAKVGAWGKVPFVENTGFGLSALQGWRAKDGVFETELRAGLFHGSGAGTAGLLAYRRTSGGDFLSRDGVATGAQAFYSPSEAVNIFLTWERSEADGKKAEQRFLAGVDMVSRKAADVEGLAAALAAGDGEAAGDILALADAGLAALASPRREKRDAQSILNVLRGALLDRQQGLVLDLPGGVGLVTSPRAVLEAARAMEKQEFRSTPASGDPPIPGWALVETPNWGPKDAMRQLLRKVQAGDLDRARQAAGGRLEERMAAVVMIHASAIRRNVDYRVIQAALLLAAVAQEASDNPSRRAGGGGDGRRLWQRMTRLSRAEQAELAQELARAGAWVRQEFRLEGEKLRARLKAHGKDRLREARESPSWPAGLEADVSENAWPGLLTGYGEDFLPALLAPAAEHLQSKPGTLTVRFGHVPIAGSPRVRRISKSELYVELPIPDQGESRTETLKGAASAVRSALAAP